MSVSTKVFNDGTLISIINLLLNSVDSNIASQNFVLKNIGNAYQTLTKLLIQQKSLRLSAFTALLISHLTWNNQEAQQMFSTREILKRLISLSDFNELVNEGEVDSTVESLQEISFYSLLALINVSLNNQTAQQFIGKLGGIEVLVKLLKSPSYDPKKTVCLCLSNLVKDCNPNA